MDSNSDLRSRRQEYCQLDHHHDDPRNVIFKGPFPASFFFIFVFSTVNSKYVHYKISLMTGFDLWYRKRTLCQRGHNHCPPEMYFPIKSWRHTYLPTYLPRYNDERCNLRQLKRSKIGLMRLDYEGSRYSVMKLLKIKQEWIRFIFNSYPLKGAKSICEVRYATTYVIGTKLTQCTVYKPVVVAQLASDAREPQFESTHRQNVILNVWTFEKRKIKKRGRKLPILQCIYIVDL